MLNPAASLFDDLASADGAAQHAPGDWAAVRARLDSDGIAVTPPLLSEAECQQARAWFGDPGRFRSTVVMQWHGFYARVKAQDSVPASETALREQNAELRRKLDDMRAERDEYNRQPMRSPARSTS